MHWLIVSLKENLKNIDIERVPFLKFDGIAIIESTSAVGDKQTMSPLSYTWIVFVLIFVLYLCQFLFLATFCQLNRLIAFMQWEANKLWALKRFKQTIIDEIETKVKVFNRHWLFSLWREILISCWNLMIRTALIQKTDKQRKP